MQTILLRPLKESTEDFERLEFEILKAFRLGLFKPLLKTLGAGTLRNTKESAVAAALRAGRITFARGAFSGDFEAATSKELKALGAKWDRRRGVWRLAQSDLTPELRDAVAASESKFKDRLAALDKRLSQVLPEEIAGKVDSAKLFDSTLWKTDRSFRKTLGGITVAPDLTPERRQRIAAEWQENMNLYIKGFAEEQIAELRVLIRKNAFSGGRYEQVIAQIKRQYNVTQNKARFLARQETSLLMTKFKETRYTEAGINEYKWGCVAGSKNHPVRPAHKRLEGKTFRWSDPPITTEPSEPTRRNNPGQDFNCRCFAIPVFRKGSSSA